ncbi:uncharacterized protein [Rutidosis leptorrhynchoides]|uniref:uncharacterized protein n=1 Tax=Rutidosis leptorrhynchoides TaxID=125765 RepID=UPI003A9945E1
MTQYDDELDGYGYTDDEDDDEGVCGPDEPRENVSVSIVRKVLLTPKVHNSQRNLLFRIRCTIADQVPLTIGKFYRDEVMCDIVDMSACHLLFGRPWQFDLNTTHDGQKNVYQFVKDEHKVTLLPLGYKPEASKGSKVESLLTLAPTNHEFMNDVKEAREVCLLVIKEVMMTNLDIKGPAIPDVVQRLLEQFSGLVPIELPNELPPMRDIQHAIDLVPGASLPNLPHYRMNPKECAIL